MAKGSRLWAAPLFNPYLEPHIFAVGMAAGVAHMLAAGEPRNRERFFCRRLWRGCAAGFGGKGGWAPEV
jgi:hypothetical protein